MARLTGSDQPEEQVTIEAELGTLDKLMNACMERGVEIREVLGIQEERGDEKTEAKEPQAVAGIVGKRVAYLRRLQSDAGRVRDHLNAILDIAQHV